MSSISRRRAITLLGMAASVAAFGGLTGCSGSTTTEGAHVGFADDTEYRDDEVTVKILADSNLLRAPQSNDGLGRLEGYISKYQAQPYRGTVTFKVKYTDSVSMALMMMNGLEEQCDGVVGLGSTIELGAQNGILFSGRGGLSVRDLASVLNEKVVVVRASDSSVDMPAAKTLSGEDAADMSITKMQSLPDFQGKIAIASESIIDGVITNRMLAVEGMYSDSTGIGGEYSDSIKNKVIVYDSLDDLVDAVESGVCGLGFISQSCLWGDYPGIESVYEPSRNVESYKGASVTDSEVGGVVRDFLQFLTRLV